MALLCGIDLGSLRTLGYVAWLEDGELLLDVYTPTLEAPLPASPGGWPPSFIAIDAPQGLPARGARARRADLEAKAPTKILPADREALASFRLYVGLITAGIEVFWSVHERELASIFGLVPLGDAGTTVCETYPRYVFKQLFPGVPIPSKRKDPFAYVEAVWPRIQSLGYSCPSVLRPGVDHLDAMLCALSAEACLEEDGALPPGTVGTPPVVDLEGRVLREGYIVAPGRRG